ncbi:nitroreductase family protein [Brevibacillus laterosporus]|uniref:nitroreductase family protein n=1 Tax=Brevibacillus laterosporus TaxID=1465 RepID=UPI001EF3B847|nr:nitroreductase family protein [Brevibacillus laterosporus]MCG7319344.1 nitroreductase family protein [Brevibacillus laterosporus]
MNTATFETLVEVMKARHSVRKYETGVEIPRSELNEILELAASAPSSWNLQHWRFLVVTNQGKKEKLLPLAYNQQQVVDASAVIIVLGDVKADLAVRDIYGKALQDGLINQQVFDIMVNQVEGAYASNAEIGMKEAILNASLASMQLMLAAKAKGYDTCPMGGIDRDGIVKECNIPERYYPVMMLTLGKASTPAHSTGRLPLSEVVINESF